MEPEGQSVGLVVGTVAATPLQFGAFERASPRPAPVLGQHTDEILSAILGLPAHEIGRLHDEKVVGGPTR